jgi:hypothetical protein
MTYLFTLISDYAAAYVGSVTDITWKRFSTRLVEKLGKKYLARRRHGKAENVPQKKKKKAPKFPSGP